MKKRDLKVHKCARLDFNFSSSFCRAVNFVVFFRKRELTISIFNVSTIARELHEKEVRTVFVDARHVFLVT